MWLWVSVSTTFGPSTNKADRTDSHLLTECWVSTFGLSYFKACQPPHERKEERTERCFCCGPLLPLLTVWLLLLYVQVTYSPLLSSMLPLLYSVGRYWWVLSSESSARSQTKPAFMCLYRKHLLLRLCFFWNIFNHAVRKVLYGQNVNFSVLLYTESSNINENPPLNSKFRRVQVKVGFGFIFVEKHSALTWGLNGLKSLLPIALRSTIISD